MNSFIFATDKPDATQVEALIQWALRPVSDHAWMLLDCALLGQSAVTDFIKHIGLTLENVFSHSELQAFGSYAPHLVRLVGDAESRRRCMEGVLMRAGNAPAVSVLRGIGALGDLQRLFSGIAKIQVENRQAAIHCRFADTRILPSLMQTLTRSQTSRMAGIVDGFACFGRSGELLVWYFDDLQRSPDEDEGALRFSVEQFRAMQRAAEPDAIFLMLTQKTPELVPKGGLAAFHARVEAVLQTADSFGIRQSKDRLQFVVLSLACGENFHAVSELQPTWNAIAAQGASLLDLMQDWSDAVWKELDTDEGRKKT